MYVDCAKVKGKNKIYERTLLRTSYWDNGKVRHKTIANLSKCSKEEIVAIKLALKHKKNLNAINFKKQIEQGQSIGAIYVLNEIAKRLGISKSLGNEKQGLLALWQILARIIDQGSRLSSVRLAMQHAVCDVLDLNKFNEDDLYTNLHWIAKEQTRIENELFDNKKTSNLFLYDVTSSYCEGKLNEFAEYGYNRDKKNGKKQIVIGLLTNEDGAGISIQVFKGNTKDNTTVDDQIEKIKNRFNVKNICFVGDKGMIKGSEIQNFPENCTYITTITKPEIETLIANGTLQMEFFEDDLCTIEKDNIRLILRRNPIRAKEIAYNRVSKLKKIKEQLDQCNKYLIEHKKSKPQTVMKQLQEKINKFKIDSWVSIKLTERTVSIEINEEALAKTSKLDGCYVIKTNVSKKIKSEIVHEKYKDLALVENAFRTMKTTHLEIRPYFVRKAQSTIGHVFVVMLAFNIIRYLRKAWKSLDITVEEGIKELSSICAMKVDMNESACHVIPKPRLLGEKLLVALDIVLPEVITCRKSKIATRKKLVTER